MHILAWLATGLVAGLVANLVANRRLAGLFGSIALGLLGAVAGGWLFRLLGITAPESGMAHVATAAFGALTLIAAQRLWANAIPGARAVASAAIGVLSRDQLAARVAAVGGRAPRQAPVIMLSQNRQAEKARLNAKLGLGSQA